MKVYWNACKPIFVTGFIASTLVYLCTVSILSNSSCRKLMKNGCPAWYSDLPVIYVITPTYRRLEQMAELTRLAQTLLNVPALHWIVVEDADNLSLPVSHLLQRYTIPYTHLHAAMPVEYRNMTPRPRGVSNRNAALDWIIRHVKTGVFYFADDDNSYDVRLFEEMRHTKIVSMWPVGLIGSYGVSAPIVDPLNGSIVGFFDGWIGDRVFAVDMASFAVNVEYFLTKPNARLPFIPGYEEDGFLRSLEVRPEDIEPLAHKCSKIMVWHTKTRSHTGVKLSEDRRLVGTNVDYLQEEISFFLDNKR